MPPSLLARTQPHPGKCPLWPCYRPDLFNSHSYVCPTDIQCQHGTLSVQTRGPQNVCVCRFTLRQGMFPVLGRGI